MFKIYVTRTEFGHNYCKSDHFSNLLKKVIGRSQRRTQACLSLRENVRYISH